MISLLNVLLWSLGVPALLAAGYLLLATLLSARPVEPKADEAARRFRIIVPAHNESAGIAETVRSLLALDYPKALFDVLVVADNCHDDTAERARSAGAQVLERHDTKNRGKGYALHHAFERLPADVDAVVVVDADTLVSSNLLRAFAARRQLGAVAIQADYAVRNIDASWRTRLIAIAFGSFHIVRSRARERLRLSCGLRGNGMCFSTALLSEVPHHAYSIVEDVEYGVRLGEAGYRVHYADEAHVYGEMVSGAAAASSQRRRWEEGRRDLVRRHGKRLLAAGVARRNRVLFDLGVDLMIPPLSRVALLCLLFWAASVGVSLFAGRGISCLWGFSACLCAVVAYVLRGWSVSGTGLRGLVDLGLAPVYVAWKLGLRLRRNPSQTSSWVRTKREGRGD